MFRERFQGDLKDAIKARDSVRVSTLRLICAAIKDRDIAERTEDNMQGCSDAEVLAMLAKMIKQRQDSAALYEAGGRLDLAAQERAEIGIIRTYLPKPMSEPEIEKAIAEAIANTGASSVRDMGKVMAHLKARHTGKMDFARAGAAVKQAFR
jgi:uncharacterized protein YqeY